MSRWVLVFPISLLFLATTPSGVSAEDDTTTILGLLGDEADIALADELSQYLRDAADARDHLNHTGKDQTLEQVAMAFGCLETLDPMCIQEIGEGLETTNLVYGRVEHVDDGFEVSVTLFDVPAGEVIEEAVALVPEGKQGSIYLQEAADRLLAELFDEPPVTALIIQSNVAGATIWLDDEEVGETGSEPLWLRDIEPGEHDILIEKDGYESFEKTVDVAEGKRTDVDAPLMKEGGVPDEGGGVTPVGGGPTVKKKTNKAKVMLWSGVGVGVLGLALVGTGIGMTSMVSSANSDLADARAVTLSGQDVCTCFSASLPSDDCFGTSDWPSGVSRGKVKNACDDGEFAQTSQFIFYGIGAAALAAGVALVTVGVLKLKKDGGGSASAGEDLDDEDDLGEDGEDDEFEDDEFEDEEDEDDEFEYEEEASLQIVPSFSPDGGFISIIGRF